MRRAHSLLLAVAACLPLAGCYYDPDYGYVRNGTGADAYYGEETVVSPGAYSPGYRYYDYGPACCYSSLSVGTVWYDRYDGRRYDRRGGDWHGRPPPRGDWHDRHDNDRHSGGNWHGDGGRGGWRGDNRPDRDDHRPGNWQGGGNRPSGGWHGGGDRGGDHRPAPTATPRAAPSVRQAGTGRDRSRFRSTTD
ncbi:hypothetical protein [Luteibacter yeojuensis]|uniref:hypothetical protein n=1 Tax=Luteibacter yeojuensis TaxID=345309 RepID=UPI0018788FF6|nr:hypothetical protein [Luteibacter yeojuensis]